MDRIYRIKQGSEGRYAVERDGQLSWMRGDLFAGYIVLRGEAPGDTLQAITTAPVTANSYRDETVKPGVRYVYAVVAVDTAKPQNVSAQSNRAEETARQ